MKPRPLWINLDGEPHVMGARDCCAILGKTCNKCGGFVHGQPIYGGIAYACEVCDADEFTRDEMSPGVAEWLSADGRTLWEEGAA